MLAVVLAGDRRVWRICALAAAPLVLLTIIWCAVPRDYYTGTNSTEPVGYIAPTAGGVPLCLPGLEIPAGTGRIQLSVVSSTSLRPSMTATLQFPGTAGTVTSSVAAQQLGASRYSLVSFPIPAMRHERAASLCVTASNLVNWGGTPLPVAATPADLDGSQEIAGRIAVWYQPPAGDRSSYLARLGSILARAALLRPGIVGPWLYAVMLFLLLPGLALASVRCMAIAAAAGPHAAGRRMALALMAIALANFACWALITPPFQAPDEVDHFAYTQSVVERGEAPSRNPASPLSRWSAAENLALSELDVLTDHQVGDTKVPWTARQQSSYERAAAALPPGSAADGGGNETAATHGPIYYLALAPAYLIGSGSLINQLTLMRLTSALIASLTVLFAFMLVRELAPGRPWMAVLAALLVLYEPMFGFISGAVNNDVGVNAGAAALELLSIITLRRGLNLVRGLLMGGLLLLMPMVKGTVYSIYPVVALALLAALWRHRRRAELAAVGALAVVAVAVREITHRIYGALEPSAAGPGSGPAQPAASSTGAVGEALAHPFAYASYVWQVFLPRLSFMTPHFEGVGIPAFTIFIRRGWGAFGWYDVLFPQWVFDVIFAAVIAAAVLAVLSALRERDFVRRNIPESVVLVLYPIAVVAGVEAAFFSIGVRTQIPEFGRYLFPAIVPLAALVVASLGALGRRRALPAGAVLLAAMIALSYAGQLLTLTGFYA